MSIRPRKEAPSPMPTLGATRSPSTVAVSRSLMASVAVISPLTLPMTMTVFATTCALSFPIRANGQHVLFQLDIPIDAALDGEVLLGP